MGYGFLNLEYNRLRDEGAYEVAGCSRGCRPVITAFG
jgi:hypothetical protein